MRNFDTEIRRLKQARAFWVAFGVIVVFGVWVLSSFFKVVA